jgi:hypothetical protein
MQQPALGRSDVQHLINVHFTHPAAFAAMRTRPAMLYVPSAPVFVPEPSEGRRTLHLHPRQVFCIQPRCDRGPRQSRPRTGGVLFPYPTSFRATSVAPSQRTSALLIPSPRMRACQPDSDFPWYSVVLRCRVPHLIDVTVRLSSPMHLVGCTRIRFVMQVPFFPPQQRVADFTPERCRQCALRCCRTTL